MNPTSLSVLDRLKVARPDASDGNRLQGIYLPLIPPWLGRVPGLGDESADLAQEVLLVVFREVPRFGIPGTSYLIPAVWLGLSQATERDSVLAPPQSKSRILRLWMREK